MRAHMLLLQIENHVLYRHSMVLTRTTQVKNMTVYMCDSGANWDVLYS